MGPGRAHRWPRAIPGHHQRTRLAATPRSPWSS